MIEIILAAAFVVIFISIAFGCRIRRLMK